MLWKINENTVERADGTVVRECATAAEAASYVEQLQRRLRTLAVKTPITLKVGDEEKYPISDQKSANSAWKLRSHGKGVSEAAVVAHIRRACKALGLEFPGEDDADGGKDEDSEGS